MRLISLCLALIPFNTYAMQNVAYKQDSHVLLTPQDYGILSKQDLAMEVPSIPFSTKNSLGYLYWQCFPTREISLHLSDMGYSASDLKEHDGFLKVSIHHDNIVHEYIMRRQWPITGCAKRLKHWEKLMRYQQYACVLGRYSHQIIEPKKQVLYVWIFEKFKTLRGTESYFIE